MSALQTLDRGILALKVVADHPAGLSMTALAEALEVPRANVYRIVETLEGHALVARTAAGKVVLGSGVLLLAARFEPRLRAAAQPLLHALARETAATAFLTAPQGEEAVALMVAEPEGGVLSVGYRVGSRHPLTVGAAGLAILAGRPERPDEPPEVRQARRDGYCLTQGQLQRGAVGVASPIHGPATAPGGFQGSVGVVALEGMDTARAISAVQACARRLAGVLGG
ncbi:IclR family transcriptional regulator [Novispirillum sp. DQ9]|uniref:IclR family transcriptional regulator n=1 Tax=Novispirillum sp. DQ9 TaxID=3398612 RepID=UPI003C7C9CFB